MKTTAQLINSLPWPDAKYQYAVVNTRPDGSFFVVYSDDKPHFHSLFHFWFSNTAVRTTTMNGEETTDWKSAIVTYEEWISAQPPAQRIPQVGETWMSSGGQVKIVRVHNRAVGSALRWHCCAEYADGMLDIFNLEELKPMPTPRELFVNSVMEKIEEHIEPAATILDIAILISVGKLDAELAALGYTKTNQQ